MFLFCESNSETTRAMRKTMAKEQEKFNGVGGIVNLKK